MPLQIWLFFSLHFGVCKEKFLQEMKKPSRFHTWERIQNFLGKNRKNIKLKKTPLFLSYLYKKEFTSFTNETNKQTSFIPFHQVCLKKHFFHLRNSKTFHLPLRASYLRSFLRYSSIRMMGFYVSIMCWSTLVPFGNESFSMFSESESESESDFLYLSRKVGNFFITEAKGQGIVIKQ